jgi:hypothetical protein
VGHGEPWGSLSWGGELAEGGFPWRAGSAARGARRRRGGAGEVQWVTRKLARGL